MESTNANILTEMEQDVIGEVMNISLGSSATSLSTLLNQRVEITVPKVHVVSAKEFEFKNLEPAIGVEIQYVEGISGYNVMLLKRDDVRLILQTLMGTEISEEDFELDEIAMSAVCEVMNQMMGSAATALADFLSRTVNISTPVAYEVDDKEDFKERYFKAGDHLVAVTFDLKVGDIINSEFVNVISVPLSKELVSLFMEGTGLGAIEEEPVETTPENEVYDFEEEVEKPAPAEIKATVEETIEKKVESKPIAEKPVRREAAYEEEYYEEAPRKRRRPAPEYEDEYYEDEYYAPKPRRKPRKTAPVNIKPVQYESFDDDEFENLTEEQKTNLELIMTVPLKISVEIGRTKKRIKEILEFSQGTIVELDKTAGTQVDIIANGQKIAKGDVVVVNDNYGVRVTEIVKKEELVNLTKK